MKECKQITGTTITYFQKMFLYALQDNGGDASNLRTTLLLIVPHAYGDHKTCSKSWCGALTNANSCNDSSLPYGKDLTCGHKRLVLDEIFTSLAEQSEKLAPLGSSQVNEAFNNTVTSKAPKSRHNSG